MDAHDGFEQRRAKSVDQMRNILTQYAVKEQSSQVFRFNNFAALIVILSFSND